MSAHRWTPYQANAQGGPTATSGQPVADALRIRVQELETRIADANTRHEELSAQLAARPPIATLPPGQRAATRKLEHDLRGVEGRIANLQSELRITQARLEEATAPRSQPALPPPEAPQPTPPAVPAPGILVPSTLPAPPAQRVEVDIVWIVVAFALVFPICMAIAWRILRGGESPAATSSEERILGIEEAVDAVATDVERVSEGQRFLTNVLTEGTVPTAAPAPGSDRASIPRRFRD